MSEQTRDMNDVIGELSGHSSMCWIPRPSGEFDITEASKAVNQAKTDLHAIFKRVMEGEKKADPTCYCDGSGKDPDGMCDCEFTRNEAIDRAIQVHGMMMGVGEG